MVETLSLIIILVIQLQLQIKPLKRQVITWSQTIAKHLNSNLVDLESNRKKEIYTKTQTYLSFILFRKFKQTYKLINKLDIFRFK
jgi:hypothetical protein